MQFLKMQGIPRPCTSDRESAVTGCGTSRRRYHDRHLRLAQSLAVTGENVGRQREDRYSGPIPCVHRETRTQSLNSTRYGNRQPVELLQQRYHATTPTSAVGQSSNGNGGRTAMQ